jgi:hypothetical protein
MNTKKAVGWVLVAAGIMVIGFTINLSYQFFTAKADFPAVFKSQAVAVENTNLPQESQDGQIANPADAQAQMQQAIGQATSQAINGMIPAGSLEKILNAICWSIFATFSVYAGAKISEIGIKLLA